MQLHPSIRDSLKVTGLTLSLESSALKVVQAQFASEPTMYEQQSVPNPVYLITRQIKYVA
ncbi:unnamed protein product [Hymenolepis diminuta]|uniref:Uncharacterized protein n=1 Tax=Hymenolepis diminuta TaxID=6216 RepID=A0A564YBE6_HYMDI|nr:unnamed protein product [Hymenolepis diminuta]